MKLIALAPILGIGILAGCVGKDATNEVKPEMDGPSPLGVRQIKVALLTPGSISDAGWSAMAYDGLKSIEAELGAKISNREATGTKIRDEMRAYAQDGFDLIIGHGFEYNEVGVELSKDFPDTVFLSSSGGKTSANAGAIRFYLEQGFYLSGMLAAEMSKTGKLAMIGGPDVPSIRSTFKAFRAGAKAANPKIEVQEIFTNKDSDIAAAQQATLKAIDAGADMVIHQANAGAQGVFDACKARGVYAFGANLNQNDNTSGVVLASPIIVAKPAFLSIARQVLEKTYKGNVALVGMDHGGIDFIINPKLQSKIPDAVLTKISEIKKKLIDGELVVPKDNF